MANTCIRTHVEEKPKEQNKLKRHHDKRRDETKQFEVGDKILLEEKDHRIATSKHNTNGVIPFRPYFDQIDNRGEEFQLLNPSWPHEIEGLAYGCVLGRGLTTGRRYGRGHGRVKIGQIFFLRQDDTRAAINCHGRARRPNGRVGLTTGVRETKGAPRSCVMRLCRPRGLDRRVCPRAVWDTDLKHQTTSTDHEHGRVKPYKGVGEANERAHGRATRPFTPDGLPTQAWPKDRMQTIMVEHDNPGIVQFCLGGLVRQLSVPEFRVDLELYTENFMEAENFSHLHRHIYYALLSCWNARMPATGRQESTGVVNTHDPYFLRSMRQGHIFYLAYFIAFACRHQNDRQRKRVISLGPYVTRLARYFGLMNTVTQSSSLTLIGQMSPQGIQSMLHMRMIERRHGFDPPQKMKKITQSLSFY
ncbi:hypothetical protein GOBAR_AA12591 [Gossypium barbadense]|uniref:Uncharacterized protein n=1 Tax=Gossypium barbadense TaxID=3634 RepID=A0A2P5XXM6_GOSBA|nr:hypothetical protein GOBAR_AA12591 [Gossypium barbadense]